MNLGFVGALRGRVYGTYKVLGSPGFSLTQVRLFVPWRSARPSGPVRRRLAPPSEFGVWGQGAVLGVLSSVV